MFCGTPGLPYNPIVQFDLRQRGRKTDLSIAFMSLKKNMLKACKTILLVYQYTANLNWL